MKKSAFVTIGFVTAIAGQALATSPMPREDQRYIASIASEEDTCRAEMFMQNLKRNSRYLSEAQSASKNDPNLRIVEPNTPMTLDYNASRLTVIVDRQAKTITMRCG